MSRFALLLLPWLVACDNELPSPKITFLSPTQTMASSPTQIRATVDAVLPFNTNYGNRSGQVETTVFFNVGPLRLYQGSWPMDGEFSVYLPSVLQPASYDVVVGLSDGRQAISPGGLIITPGAWPLSYSFGTVDAQVNGQPFTVHVQALGGDAATFAGNLTLTVSSGDVQPRTTDALVNGELFQTVTVRAATGAIQLTVRDSAGHFGISNNFPNNKGAGLYTVYTLLRATAVSVNSVKSGTK
jgi:hypothetical protein